MKPSRCMQLALTAFVVSGAGCSTSYDEPAAAASEGDEASPQEITRSGLTEGQLLKALATVDTAEIQQAQVALTKATMPQVRNFASDMIEQHTRAKQQGESFAAHNGLALRTSPTSDKLLSHGREVLDKLQRTDVRDFDDAYVQAQLDQHAAVLNMLDKQWIPGAPSALLKQHLSDARAMIQQHLSHAQQLRDAVSAAGDLKPASSAPQTTPLTAAEP